MFDEEELADCCQNGGQEFPDEVVHAEFGDEQEYQQLAEGIANKIHNEEWQETLPYFVLDFEVEFPVQEKAGDHGYLIADGVGQQLVHVTMGEQGENPYIDGRGHTANHTV